MSNTSDDLVQRVARAILEADPTCNYDKAKKRVEDDVARGSDLELGWWDHLHDQARAAIAAAQAWQPIKSAPDNGDRFLLLYRSGDGPVVAECRFVYDRYQTALGWFSSRSDSDMLGWMPLPFPPEADR